ncbi:hypothetical protein KC866_03385 [Patescibacteria group bacterium]|nr:hypothetical protein [Patescibacteria group bacterium]
MNYVTYDEFKKMDMRVGLIRCVESIDGADKLLRFEIDFGVQSEHTITCTGECRKESCDTCDGECTCDITCTCEPGVSLVPFGKDEYRGRDVRQIVSGIREYWPAYKELEGRYGLYILNLEPREIRGVMSHGMLMAVDGTDGNPVFLGPQGDIDPGARVR